MCNWNLQRKGRDNIWREMADNFSKPDGINHRSKNLCQPKKDKYKETVYGKTQLKCSNYQEKRMFSSGREKKTLPQKVKMRFMTDFPKQQKTKAMECHF